ncbi:MAG: HEAT repeat domain-containing protein [Acidimicrobiia bacterium]|jgi:HEAT repeat protein
MQGIELVRVVVLIVFALNALLLLALIVGKAIHRRVTTSAERRRSAYIAILSRHLALPDEDVKLGRRVAGDPAFLDALIDVRNTVIGPEADALGNLVDQFGIVHEAVKRLKSGYLLTTRLRAAVALAELADQSSAEVLMTHLSDRSPVIRIQCARGLGRMRWTPAIDAIVERFRDETPWVRSRFADTLVRFDRAATWPLVAYVKINHRFETEGPVAAIRTLATIGDDQAVTPMIQILTEASDLEVRLAAIEALGILSGPLAIRPLRVVTRDDDWRIRAKAASALGEIGDLAAGPTLASCLTDENWWVRRNSAAALAQLPEGEELLYEALDSEDVFARDAAAEALADKGAVLGARHRLLIGEASEDDQKLIEFIEEQMTVTT